MALKLLRDNLKHLKFILWGVIFIFIVLVFATWGSGQRGLKSSGYAVTVGSYQVTEKDFLRQVKDLQDTYQRQLGDNWERFRNQINLGQQAAQQIIQRRLMLEAAEEAGLVVPAEELRKKILSFSSFKDADGNFIGLEKYRKVLRSWRLTPQEFEEDLREQLLLRKLQNLMEDSVYVSDEEVEEALRREKESATLHAVQLRYERFLAEVELDDEELKAYYEANKEDFSRPEERVIRYLVVETNKLRRMLEVTDEEIDAYYAEHSDDFKQGEQMRASHILFKVDPGMDPAAEQEIKLKAQQVLKLAETGADFAELAKIHSEDPGSKEKGGDVGWFGHGRMVKEFDEAVFAAKPGDLIGPVKSRFGYHIIKVTGHKPPHVQPLEEVRNQVRVTILKTRAIDEAKNRAEALAERIKKEKPDTEEAWQAIADEDEAISLNESPPFSKDDTIPGTGSDPELTTEIFKASEGAIGGPKPIPRGWMVWQLKKIAPEGIPSFEDARGEVEQKVRQAKALELATAAAEELVGKLKDGGDLTALAGEYGSSVVEVKDHRRGSAFSSLGVLPSLDRQVFSAKAGDVLGPVIQPEHGAVVARVDSVTLLDQAAIDEGKEAMLDRLRREKSGELLNSILAEKRRNTTVTVDPEIVSRFAPKPDKG